VATWNARTWVAALVGCRSDELSILSSDAGQVRYADTSGNEVALLVIAGPMRPLDGTADGYYEVKLRLADGTFHSPTEVIRESDSIAL
jgi:hypothetical protein